MKRSDVIRSVKVQFKRMRISDAMSMLDCVIEEMENAIANDNRIEIRGFGTFQSRERATKIGFNPSTGERIRLNANRTILFKPSRELIKKMNG
ncbi:MAG: integration host factor subunit beta [Alphaproteobacteria bacterium]|nr:integration host factor subunit beta [Alphaproteobacteria bacterium]